MTPDTAPDTGWQLSAGPDEAAAREALIAHALQLAPSGLSKGTSGNLSLRLQRRDSAGQPVPALLITPSGVDYRQLRPEHLACMRLDDGRWHGPLKPSSEWRFHRDILLQRPEFNAVVHAHATHATALATQRRGIPAFHYMVAVAGGRDIRCAPYATYGTDALSQAALTALQDRRACLLANHGLIACGPSLPRAFALAIEVEELAQQYLLAHTHGQPVVLDDAEMDRVLEGFKHYGAQAQGGATHGQG